MLREAVSQAGRRVTLAIECSGYSGAQPTYVITRWTKTGRPAELRYVPETYGIFDDRHPEPIAHRQAEARARAEAIFADMLQDGAPVIVGPTDERSGG